MYMNKGVNNNIIIVVTVTQGKLVNTQCIILPLEMWMTVLT